MQGCGVRIPRWWDSAAEMPWLKVCCMTAHENGGAKPGLGWKPVAGAVALGVLTVVAFVVLTRLRLSQLLAQAPLLFAASFSPHPSEFGLYATLGRQADEFGC